MKLLSKGCERPAEGGFPVCVGGDDAAGDFDADMDHGVLHAAFGVHQDAVGITQQT